MSAAPNSFFISDPLLDRIERRSKREHLREQWRDGLRYGIQGGLHSSPAGLLNGILLTVVGFATYFLAIVLYHTGFVLFDEAKKKFGKKKRKKKRPKVRVRKH